VIGCDVIIVNYNAGPLLAACVQSALASRPVRQVIVVDNASADDSLAQLAERITDGRARVIRNGGNLGFAAACNIGLAASHEPHILFLNPDSVLAPGALDRLSEALDSDARIGMVGGFLANPDGSEQPGGRRTIPTPGRAFIRAFGLSRLGRRWPSLFGDFLLHDTPLPDRPTPVDAISGACMLVKRTAIDAVGPWDEGYFLHCEDLDWCLRFRQAGWRILFVPDAQVTHEWGACSRSRPVFVEWHKHRGMLRFYRKFFRERYPGGLWALVVAGVWLRFGVVAGYYWVRRWV